MKNTCLLILTIFAGFTSLVGQSTAFVLKGGGSIGTQKWDNSFDRNPLFKYHGAIAIESVDNENNGYSLFTQFGYHVRGSATRFRFLFTGGGAQTYSQEFRFNNLSLLFAAKSKKPLGAGGKTRYFYYGGLRGDYTLNTNIDDLAQPNSQVIIYYPFIGGVQRWMAGVSIGGGVEYDLRELVGLQFEFSINPDITPQYKQGPINNVIDPFNPGQTISIAERRIRNVTIEFSVGVRLLRKVVYEE